MRSRLSDPDILKKLLQFLNPAFLFQHAKLADKQLTQGFQPEPTKGSLEKVTTPHQWLCGTNLKGNFRK